MRPKKKVGQPPSPSHWLSQTTTPLSLAVIGQICVLRHRGGGISRFLIGRRLRPLRELPSKIRVAAVRRPACLVYGELGPRGRTPALPVSSFKRSLAADGGKTERGTRRSCPSVSPRTPRVGAAASILWGRSRAATAKSRRATGVPGDPRGAPPLRRLRADTSAACGGAFGNLGPRPARCSEASGRGAGRLLPASRRCSICNATGKNANSKALAWKWRRARGASGPLLGRESVCGPARPPAAPRGCRTRTGTVAVTWCIFTGGGVST